MREARGNIEAAFALQQAAKEVIKMLVENPDQLSATIEKFAGFVVMREADQNPDLLFVQAIKEGDKEYFLYQKLTPSEESTD